MTVRLSTGLRNAMVGTAGFAGALAGGFIEVYSGPQPLTADAAKSGTLLGRITVDAGTVVEGEDDNGLTFESAAAGAVAKKTSEVWKMVGIAAGTAGWWRFRGNAADAGAQSTSLARMDGVCGVGGAGDMALSTLNIEVGRPVTVDVFSFALPASA